MTNLNLFFTVSRVIDIIFLKVMYIKYQVKQVEVRHIVTLTLAAKLSNLWLLGLIIISLWMDCSLNIPTKSAN